LEKHRVTCSIQSIVAPINDSGLGLLERYFTCIDFGFQSTRETTVARMLCLFSDPIQQKPEPRGRLRNHEHLSHRYFNYLSLA
jgi:hypothetical protein